MREINPKFILRDNVAALAKCWYGEVNTTRLGKDTGINVGGAQRVLGGETNVGIELIAAIARRARLSPWQLLVPHLDPGAPPQLHTPTGEPLPPVYIDAARTQMEMQLVTFFRGMSSEHQDDLLSLANRWFSHDNPGPPSAANPYPARARKGP